jgi:predicted ATPase
LRIAITGAHRTGKTTLAEKLRESLPHFTLTREPYLELEENGFVFPAVPNHEDYVAQLEYSIDQISIEDSNVIFDRCPADFLAYMQVATEAGDMQSLYHKVGSVMTRIDLLVFVPIEELDIISCPESELPELRALVNEVLHDWLEDFGVDMVVVTGTLQERYDQVMEKVS